MRKLLLGFIFLLMISSVFATVESLGVFRQGTCVNLLQTCGNCSYVNLSSVKLPNSSVLYFNTAMTQDGSTYNYTFCNTAGLGNYIVNTLGDGQVAPYDFEVTPDGTIMSSSQGVIAIGILISVFLLTFFFGFMGFKLTAYPKIYVIALFFMVVAIIISVYGTYLGFVYSRDYLYTSTASGPQEKIFLGILFGLTGMMFIALLTLIIKTIGELRERKAQKRYGEGYNTQTRSYEN